MSAAVPSDPGRHGWLAPTGLLLVVAVLFSTASRLPWFVSGAIAVGGVVAGTAMMLRWRGSAGAFLAPAPVVGAFLVLALSVASTPTSDLLGGLAGLTVLLWLAGEPGAGPRAVVRSLSTVASTALIVMIAWTSALLLPRSPALLGVGGALLVIVVVAVAILLGRPDLIDAEPSATA